MVKFGLQLRQNRAPEYPPEAYMDYDKLKEIIKELAGKKLARYVRGMGIRSDGVNNECCV